MLSIATSCVFPMHMYVKDLVVIVLEIAPHGQPELQVFVTVIFPVTDAVTNCITGNRNTELFKIIFWLLLNTSGVLLFVWVCFFEGPVWCLLRMASQSFSKGDSF